MTSKAQRQEAFVEATASLRLEGLPVSTKDDDLYAAAIEGLISGSLLDLVSARIRDELASEKELGSNIRAILAELAGQVPQFIARNCAVHGQPGRNECDRAKGGDGAGCCVYA